MPDDDLGADFREFMAWRDAKRKADADKDFEVPIYEKLPDGTERSATLPFSRSRTVLEKWWPDLAEVISGGEGKDDESGKATGQGNVVQQFFKGTQNRPKQTG